MVWNCVYTTGKIASVPCGIETGRIWPNSHSICGYAKACVSFYIRKSAICYSDEPAYRLAFSVDRAKAACQTQQPDYHNYNEEFQYRLLDPKNVGYRIESSGLTEIYVL